MTPYCDFLARKGLHTSARGLASVPSLAGHLFPFQAHCVDFALRIGSSGCFLDTGLGKTECQLEWCEKALRAGNGRALLMTPLAVAGQTLRRAEKWGYDAQIIRQQSDFRPGINICNYDRLHLIDPAEFNAVSLDEASVLKSFAGKTARALIDAFRRHRFRLMATATPAPNDHMEIGQYAEFAGVMVPQEMLSRFFINDTSTASQEWRLKGHAVASFYDWLASWSRMAEKPSDLGDDDTGFDLPPYKIISHRARDVAIEGVLADLFGVREMTATTMHEVKRQTAEARAELVGELVAKEPNEAWIIWCDTDYEADRLIEQLPNAIEVRGSQDADEKEEKLTSFAEGKALQIIGKPSMMGLGLDWSHAARMAFVGRSFSYESWYQAIRRAWRFGQKRELVVHLVVAEGEQAIGRVIDRKAGNHSKMKVAMRMAMARATNRLVATREAYLPTRTMELPTWIA